ncbi:hypothetical protein BP5796_04015 [Coleophoma crateriformis]|uniref:Heterokaryon incompatibility domain-containing protein n=1 Tax=Coleophoma crateriformis TaxID=565419 RepID=A0A3D8SH94_9HELO|nr:hypothetical protein BP5796_04015 [Coleophoma crateriformis]
MEGGSNQPTRTISSVALSCIEIFHRCLSRDRNAFAKLEGEERRFWAWSNSLKVFEEQHINLDAQLNKHAQIREMVLLLLGVLKDNLSLAFNCDVSPEALDRDVLQIPFFGIDGSLRRLERIATAIAHATHASLTRRVLLYAKKQDDYEEVSRIFSLSIIFRYRGLRLEDMPMLDVPVEHIPSPDKIMAPQPLGLFLSLVKTSVIRHYRICYQRNIVQEDSKKPTPQVVSAKSIKPAAVDLNRAEQRLERADDLLHTRYPELNTEITQSEAMSNPLTLETAEFKKKLGEDASGSGRRAERQLVSEAGVALVPSAPRMSDGQKSGTCPICRESLPANIFESRLSWISHVYKDVQPYVCISEDCMSNLQYFDNCSSWINHMHKAHTTHWVRYLHNTYHWNCPVCHDISPIEFISKQEMEQNLIGHLGQSHSAIIKKSNRRHLASVSGVPRHRPLDTCPICGTHYQLMPLSETPDIPQNDEADYDTKDAAGSKVHDSGKATSSAKKACFEDSTISDSEERKQSTIADAALGLQLHNIRSSKPTRLTGVEKCISEHIRGIAFHFSRRLIDDEYEDDSGNDHTSFAASKVSVDSTLRALEHLSSIGSKADPPQFPLAHYYAGPAITDKEKEEVKLCITRNSKELLECYKWDDNRRVEDLKVPSTELENMFPDTYRKSNNRIWTGMDPRYALAYVACLMIILEICKKALVAIEDRKSNIMHMHEQLEKFSYALKTFPGRDLDAKFDPRGYLTAIDEYASQSQAICATLASEIRLASDPQYFSNDTSLAIKDKVNQIERAVRLRIGLADINGRVRDIDVLEEHELPSSLPSSAQNLIKGIVFDLIQVNPDTFQTLGSRVEGYLDGSIEHQVHDYIKEQKLSDELFDNESWTYQLDNEFCRTFTDSRLSEQVIYQTAMACPECRSILTSNESVKLSDLENSAGVCHFCAFVIDQVRKVYTAKGADISISNADSLLQLASSEIPEPVPILRSDRFLPKVSNTSSVQLLKTWLDNCDQKHTCWKYQIKNHHSEYVLPTRLLNITPSSKLEDLRLDTIYRLSPMRMRVINKLRHIKGAVRGKPRYVALSHCWGETEPNRLPSHCTTQKNLEIRQKGFRLSELPRTFQDAVTVTRQLGIQYLWIDSLCIIQGPDGNWEEESKRMEQVFASAYCTIAATSAEDSNAGFLNQPVDDNQSIYVQHSPGQYIYVSANISDFHTDVDLANLNKRAWVMQERLLSPRTIHFSSNQVYGECGNEVYAGGYIFLRSGNESQNYYKLDPDFPNRLRRSGLYATSNFLQNLLENYTGRGISKPTDRSVAISGLMARIGDALQCPIHHGIVGRFIHRTLLWKRSPDSKKAKMQKIMYNESHKVPSWSWMAFEGAVEFLRDELGDLESIKGLTFNAEVLTTTVWELTESCIITEEERNSVRHQVLDEKRSSKGVINIDEEEKEAGLPPVQFVVVLAKRYNYNIQSDGLLYFVLFVRPLIKRDGYERFGMGMLRADCGLKKKVENGHIF